MKAKKPVGLMLIAALAAVAAMALTATTALATTIAPAATKVHATSTETRFLPNNAFGKLAVVCKETGGGKLTTPEEGALKKNQNKTGVGTFSAGSCRPRPVGISGTPDARSCSVSARSSTSGSTASTRPRTAPRRSRRDASAST
jgi:hypothetical protein